MHFYSILFIAFIGLKTALAGHVDKTAFNEKIGIRLVEELNDTNRTLLFACATSKAFACSNYKIEHSFAVKNNTITLKFTGIDKPSYCTRAFGPATARISIGSLENQMYTLIIHIGQNIVKGSIDVSKQAFIVTLENEDLVSVVNPDLKRIPENTIYGAVHYHAAATESIVKEFFDSLKHYGAKPSKYFPGNYGSFQIEENGQIKQFKNGGYRFTIQYIYTYSKDSKNLIDLVKRYGKRYPDLLLIKFHNSKGETAYSWVK